MAPCGFGRLEGQSSSTPEWLDLGKQNGWQVLLHRNLTTYGRCRIGLVQCSPTIECNFLGSPLGLMLPYHCDCNLGETKQLSYLICNREAIAFLGISPLLLEP